MSLWRRFSGGWRGAEGRPGRPVVTGVTLLLAVACAAPGGDDGEVVTAEAAMSTLNVALGRPTSQSSNFDPSRGASWSAVDGNRDGTYGSYRVAHTAGTEPDRRPWWMVDLGGQHHVDEVVIYNRTDCCGQRLADFDVQVLDDAMEIVGHEHQTGQLTDSQASYRLYGVRGRYVRVIMDDTGTMHERYLQLAEVEVFGVPTERENLGLEHLAAHSRDYFSSGAWGAGRALDGDPTTASATSYERGAYWEVELLGDSWVEELTIQPHPSYRYSLEDCLVELFDDADRVVASSRCPETIGEGEISLHLGARGNRVRISHPDRAMFVILGEVEVSNRARPGAGLGEVRLDNQLDVIVPPPLAGSSGSGRPERLLFAGNSEASTPSFRETDGSVDPADQHPGHAGSAVGDLDGDGREEWAVPGRQAVLVFGAESQRRLAYSAFGLADGAVSSLALGDVTGDGRDELWLWTTRGVELFDVAPATPVRLGFYPMAPHDADLACADTDGDGRAEGYTAWNMRLIRLTYEPNHGLRADRVGDRMTGSLGGHQLRLADVAGADGMEILFLSAGTLQVFNLDGRGSYVDRTYGVSAFTVIDVDGDRLPEVVYVNQGRSALVLWDLRDGSRVTIPLEDDVVDIGTLVATDLDHDGDDEIVTTIVREEVEEPSPGSPFGGWQQPTVTYAEQVVAYDLGSHGPRAVPFAILHALSPQSARPVELLELVAGDFMGDVSLIRPTGRQTSYWGPPHIETIIMLPPRVSTGQLGTTTIGWSTGSGSESSWTRTRSATTTLSFDATWSFGFFSAGVTSSMARSVERTRATVHEREFAHSASRTLSTSTVHYARTHRTSYEYEVVRHRDSSRVGSRMTVDIPGKTDDDYLRISEFDARFPGWIPEVLVERSDALLELPQPGVPNAFPTRCAPGEPELDMGPNAQITPTALTANAPWVTVEAGAGATAVESEEASAYTQTHEVNVSSERMAGAVLGPASWTVSASSGMARGYGVSRTSGTTYSGQLDELPATSTLPYEWALCVYDVDTNPGAPEGFSFRVVDYRARIH